MVYLDNSATSSPKPQSVINAVDRAMRHFSFNPGRGGYRNSIATAQAVYDARNKFKQFFHAEKEEQVIFTSGCTQALNMVIKGVLKPGDHVIISSFEHNSVVRPLEKMKKSGIITYSVAKVDTDEDVTLGNFRSAINDRTRLIICTHASNVFGIRLPVERICALAHNYQILFCLDAAQSAGVLDIDLSRDHYDFVCIAGHKSLYGPMGVGALIINCDQELSTVLEGGTGSESSDYRMPTYYPDRLESGTLNIPGIMGLSAGIFFVENIGTQAIRRKEYMHILRVYDVLSHSDRVQLFTERPDLNTSVPVLSFAVDGVSSEDVANYLGRYNIAVRAGLHCAPLAHRHMGTIDNGTVRISPSYFTSERDIEVFLSVMKKFLLSY